MSKKKWGIAAIIVVLAGVSVWLYRTHQPSTETIEIAAVGPGGGIHAPMRKSFRQGMQMCIVRSTSKDKKIKHIY